jgi:adenylate kinase
MDMERLMAKKVLEKTYRDEPENQEELQKLVQNFRDLYADYGAYRHKEVSIVENHREA